MTSGIREASHAGSWYTSSRSQLTEQLDEYLSNVQPIPALDFNPPVQNAKAIIAPHAGYSYSGPTAAWAYASIPTEKIKRVFLLGPSHHVYLDGVALSTCEAYETPLGDIPLDLETITELESTGVFSQMRKSADEDEHSLEMHLPYIRHVFEGRTDLALVPILVGHPSPAKLSQLSEVLSRYWQDDETFFVISSDFCHWGTRFSCTPYYPNAPSPPNPVPPVPPASASPPSSASATNGNVPPVLIKKYGSSSNTDNGGVPIWKSIQYMDHEGMDLLRRPAETGALERWEAYLARTKNTICGRNPITVLLHLIQHIYSEGPEEKKPVFSFVRYEQSSQCVSGRDSSVSYVSGVLRVPQ
ncbi:AmmeMemoRadiSam system protein B [Kwoniella dejecticola CBS 10117]|uniref:AmmeMemoRadiSam system protein B n=1 Tax=Kwoniella dejecticola CBS 10117 TaxID=1296121 RepID=A0AAJ8KXP5_9TREE